ncbi:MAG: ABC transporter ATP-binding protein [Desulfobacterales bacterium]|nr:ABC transporter ATP-binding protein [Desulfobacterales bacterium]
MIRLEELHIRLPNFSLDNVNLDIPAGEFFVLMGPTGSGKTLLLEAIAGLIKASRGRIFIDGKEVSGQPPEKRGIGIVYQDQALFPHLTVAQNIFYGLRYHQIDSGKAREHIDGLVSLLDLKHLLDRLPVNLSGGEKQRVALARALAVQPGVLLLDEPLSALDPNFRDGVRTALKTLHKNTGATFMMVSHDFTDALSLADRAAVINKGRIEQVGRVADIFKRPVSTFAADFVGMKNIFKARFNEAHTALGDLDIKLENPPDNGQGHIAIRPEDIELSKNGFREKPDNTFKGKVVGILDQGFTYEVHIQADHTIFKSLVTKRDLFQMALQEGETISIAFNAAAVHSF